MPLSEEQKDRVLLGLKNYMEQGLVIPVLKPLFLSIGDGSFSCSGTSFAGNPLPEFCSISWNILDCFAAAVISAPNLQFPHRPLSVRCRLGEQEGGLVLRLVALAFDNEHIFPLEMSEVSDVTVASNLRLLAGAKDMRLGNIYWDRPRNHSVFFLPYPGQMVRSRIPGLGETGEDGNPRWPECEVILGIVGPSLQDRAKQIVSLVRSDLDGPVQ